MPTYYNASGRPAVLACGEVVAAGATTTRVNPKHPDDQALIVRGVIGETETTKPATKQKGETS